MTGGLLALDLATSTGWCYAPPAYRPPAFAVPSPIYELLQSGYEVFGKPGTPHGTLFLEAHEWLGTMLGNFQPAIVAVERPFVPVIQYQGAGVGMGLTAIVKMEAARHNLPLYEASPNEIKVYWTGDGRAKKERMVEFCNKRGLFPKRDDEADAIALADFQVATLAANRQWPPRGNYEQRKHLGSAATA